jgi:hypothetical protein
MLGGSLVNTDASSPGPLLLGEAERRVLEIQTKLHRWARDDPHRRFVDVYNLVCDPAFLLVAWDRVRGNKGARTRPGWTGEPPTLLRPGRESRSSSTSCGPR